SWRSARASRRPRWVRGSAIRSPRSSRPMWGWNTIARSATRAISGVPPVSASAVSASWPGFGRGSDLSRAEGPYHPIGQRGAVGAGEGEGAEERALDLGRERLLEAAPRAQQACLHGGGQPAERVGGFLDAQALALAQTAHR